MLQKSAQPFEDLQLAITPLTCLLFLRDVLITILTGKELEMAINVSESLCNK